MADMVFLVSNLTVVDGMLRVAFMAVAGTGEITFGDVAMDFGISATVANKAIEDAAVAKLAEIGVTVGVLDKKIGFGGRVS